MGEHWLAAYAVYGLHESGAALNNGEVQVLNELNLSASVAYATVTSSSLRKRTRRAAAAVGGARDAGDPVAGTAGDVALNGVRF